VPLTFHRVLRDDDYRRTNSLPGIVLRERTFRDLVAHVARCYEPVDLRETKPGARTRRLRLAFTFDDGWIDTYTVAFPIAQEHAVPLTVFICPGLIDGDTPFWHEQVVGFTRATQPSAGAERAEALIENMKTAEPEQRERFLAQLREEARKAAGSVESTGIDRTLSWATITEMSRQGVRIGAHTQTHQILTTISQVEARQEIRLSKTAIESALGTDCDTFAYPNGSWSPETRRIVAEAGFELAVTTRRGAWMKGSDRFTIPRSNISEDNVAGPTGRFSPAMFAYSTIWKAWRATRAEYRLRSRAQERRSPITA
jgi:peptidoglycan/xylan/chitin deacetylase (PgdA/CDA1 family)